jgi:multiple sugar transport system permease protein
MTSGQRFMIAPWLLSVAVLVLFPLLLAACLSFCCWDLVGTPHFTGLSNYSNLASDPDFWNALKVTFLFVALQVPSEVVGGCLLGLLMQRGRKETTSPLAMSIFRTICYVPSVISGVAATLIGCWLFQPTGLVNRLLSWIGLPGPNWFLSPHYALIALWLLGTWGLGRNALIFLSALQEQSVSLEEASELDGASDLQRLRHITLPQLLPTFGFVAVTSLASSLQSFSGAYIATAGGPLKSTTTLVLFLYQNGFQFQRMGYAAAIAMVAFGLSMGVSLMMFRHEESS